MTMIATAPVAFANTRRQSLFGRIIAALVDADRRYRESAKLRAMPAERLEDMGIPTNRANAGFYNGRASRRVDATRISAPVAW
jgi:hypothetical protein